MNDTGRKPGYMDYMPKIEVSVNPA